MTNLNGTNGYMPIPAATRLRQLLAEKEIVEAPGVYDGFSARIALQVGFECMYMVWHPSLGHVSSGIALTNDTFPP